VCEELDTRPTGSTFLFCSNWTIKIFLNIWQRHRFSVELERLGKFQFVFKTNLGFESGGQVGTFGGEKTPEVKISCMYTIKDRKMEKFTSSLHSEFTE
jgi:hypothetical protein